MFLAVVLAGVLLIPGVSMRDGHRQALWEAGERTRDLELEEFYCLSGRRVGNRFYITGVVKPKQKAGITTRWVAYPLLASRTWWVRTEEPCPEGTIMDVHTHPAVDTEGIPSLTDWHAWRHSPVPYHMIIYPQADGSIRAAVWGTAPRRLFTIK